MVLTQQLMKEIQQIRATIFIRKLEKKIGENPFEKGLVKRFGETIAFQNRRVMCFNASDIEHLDKILNWYESQQLRPFFDLLPLESNASLNKELAKKGFYQKRCQSFLYGEPYFTDYEDKNKNIEVVKIGKENFSDFIDFYFEDYPCSQKEKTLETKRIFQIYKDSLWRLFLAKIEGQSVAAGLMAVLNDFAYMTDAWTLKAFERRGCQTLLIKSRINQAAREQTKWIISDTKVNTSSQRNLQKAGLSMAYHVMQWYSIKD